MEAVADVAEWAVAAVEPTDHPMAGRALCGLALVRWSQGRKAEAREWFDRCVASVPVGTSPWALGRVHHFIGWNAHLDGDDDRALDALLTSAARLAEVGGFHRSQADTLDVIGCHWGRRSDHRRVLRGLCGG